MASPNPSVKMDVDNPHTLKRSSSAPMINELNSSSAVISSQAPTAVLREPTTSLPPRPRRFSTSCSPVPLSGPSSPKLSHRVNQLRREESVDVLGREAAHERELNSAMVMSISCEDLTLVSDSPKSVSSFLDDLSKNNPHQRRSHRHNSAIPRQYCKSVHSSNPRNIIAPTQNPASNLTIIEEMKYQGMNRVQIDCTKGNSTKHLPPERHYLGQSTISSSETNGKNGKSLHLSLSNTTSGADRSHCSTPSPTRTTPLRQFLSYKNSLTPSPTRRFSRSQSPIAMRPAQFNVSNPVKRKFDLEENDPPAKKFGSLLHHNQRVEEPMVVSNEVDGRRQNNSSEQPD